MPFFRRVNTAILWCSKLLYFSTTSIHVLFGFWAAIKNDRCWVIFLIIVAPHLFNTRFRHWRCRFSARQVYFIPFSPNTRGSIRFIFWVFVETDFTNGQRLGFIFQVMFQPFFTKILQCEESEQKVLQWFVRIWKQMQHCNFQYVYGRLKETFVRIKMSIWGHHISTLKFSSAIRQNKKLSNWEM